MLVYPRPPAATPGETVPDPAPLKYRAFLSYAHADLGWAKWLHKRLEGTRFDRDLVGRATSLGPVPVVLRPIFRDREDFTGGHSLSEATTAALDRSAALIVLCSTVAAGRPAVNEQVRLFRTRHPGRPVIPVIVEGSAPQCFPPTLRHALDGDGRLTAEPITILAPDLRESGDGRELGLAMIIAGLTGLQTDEIVRRAERDRRRRLRTWVAGLAILALAFAGLAGWAEVNRREAVLQRALAEQRQMQAERNFAVAKHAADALVTDIAQSLRQQQGMRTATVRTILGRAEQAFGDLVEASGGNDQLAFSQSVMLQELSITYGTLGDTEKQEQTALKSLAIAERLAAADPANMEWQQGYLEATSLVGDMLVGKGKIEQALTRFRAAAVIAQAMAVREPANPKWADSHGGPDMRIGDVLVAMGKLDEAIASFGKVRDNAERLVTSDPANTSFLHALATAHGFIADVLTRQGKGAEALAGFRAASTIFEGLTRLDPGNTDWNRDLASGKGKIADILASQGDLPQALSTYRECLAGLERLAAGNPGNAPSQYAVGIANMKIGEVLKAQGQLDAALVAYTARREVMERLVADHPDLPDLRNRLAEALLDVGDAEVARGRLPEALASFGKSLEIDGRLVEAQPGDIQVRHHLMVTHSRLADLGFRMNDQASGQKHLEAARAVIAEFANEASFDAQFPGERDAIEKQLAGLAADRQDVGAGSVAVVGPRAEPVAPPALAAAAPAPVIQPQPQAQAAVAAPAPATKPLKRQKRTSVAKSSSAAVSVEKR